MIPRFFCVSLIGSRKANDKKRHFPFRLKKSDSSFFVTGINPSLNRHFHVFLLITRMRQDDSMFNKVLERLYMTDTILRLPQVKDKTGLSRSTIYLMIKQGKFKKPIQLGIRSVGWLQSDIEEFITERIKASRPE